MTRPVAVVTAAARPLAGDGAVPRGARRCSRRCSTTVASEHLLLLEHPHVFTLRAAGRPRAQPALRPGRGRRRARRASDRGGDITYHGPGPARRLPDPRRAGNAASAADTTPRAQRRAAASSTRSPSSACRRRPARPSTPACGSTPTGRTRARSPPSACGSRAGARCTASPSTSTTDLTYMLEHIVAVRHRRPAGHVARRGGRRRHDARGRRRRRPARRRALGQRRAAERQDVAWRHRPDGPVAVLPRRRARASRSRPGADRPSAASPQAGVTDGLVDRARRKPEWLRPKVHHGAEVLALKRTDARPRPGHGVRGGRLPEPVRVLGRRHGHVHGARRALHAGLRLLPRRHAASPSAPTPTSRSGSPRRRPDGPRPRRAHDGGPRRPRRRRDGATSPRASRRSARRRPATRVEVLISDCHGRRRRRSQLLFAARPDVLNHNVETVARLQRAVRPSAGYARSLAVLARAKAAGLTTKSGLIVGMGETDDEVVGLPRRPRRHRRRHRHHRPVPAADVAPPARSRAGSSRPSSTRWAAVGEALGIGHVEAGPLTRSSYHARHRRRCRRDAGGPERPLSRLCGRSSRSSRSHPSPSVLTAARPIATPGRWAHLGADDDAVWGSFRGSSAEPYDTVVDHVRRRRPVLVPEPKGAVQARPRAAAAVDRRPRPRGRRARPRHVVARAAPGGRRSLIRGRLPSPPRRGARRRHRPAARSPARAIDGRRPRRAAAADRPARRTRRAGGADARRARRARPLARRPGAHRPRRPGARAATPRGTTSRPGSSTPAPAALANRVRRLAGVVGARPDWHERVLAELGVLHLLAQAGQPAPRAARRRSADARRHGVRVAGPPGRRARRRSRHRPLARRRPQRHPRGPHRGPPHVAARRGVRPVGDGAVVRRLPPERSTRRSTVGTTSTPTSTATPATPSARLLGTATMPTDVAAGSARDPADSASIVAGCATRSGRALAAEPWLDRVPALVRAAPTTAAAALGAHRRHRLAPARRSVAPVTSGLPVLARARRAVRSTVTVEWTPTGLVPLTVLVDDTARSTSDLVPTRRS